MKADRLAAAEQIEAIATRLNPLRADILDLQHATWALALGDRPVRILLSLEPDERKAFWALRDELRGAGDILDWSMEDNSQLTTFNQTQRHCINAVKYGIR